MAIQTVDMTGRTGYHIKTFKAGKDGAKTDRRNLLRHHMRNLNPDDLEHFSQQNTNIATEHTHLNWDWVNVGNGKFKNAESVDEVLNYGDERLARVSRKVRADSTPFLNVNVYFPVNICEPEKTTFKNQKGEEIEGERWVVKDMEDAKKYVKTVIDQFAQELPGGLDAIHGVSVNLDETRPHITLIADSLADDGKGKNGLRIDFSRAFGTHRDVVYPDDHKRAGRQITGPEKLRSMQQRLRDRIADEGFDVERTAGGKGGVAHEMFKEISFERAKAAEETEQAKVEMKDLKAEGRAFVAKVNEELKTEGDAFVAKVNEQAKAERSKILDSARSEAEEIRKTARDEALRSAQAEAVRIIKEAEERALEFKADAADDRHLAREARQEAEQEREAARRVREAAEQEREADRKKREADKEVRAEVMKIRNEYAEKAKNSYGELRKLIEVTKLTGKEKEILTERAVSVRDDLNEAGREESSSIKKLREAFKAPEPKKPSKGYDGPEF